MEKNIWNNIGSESRSIPMWAWNGKLDEAVLKEQLLCFKEMGFGGAEIHSRIGLQTEYLGSTFMKMVEKAVDFAKEQSLKIWLYDEDKWPSGFGAGRVTAENPEYACRYLLFSKNNYPDGYHDRQKVFQTRVTGNGELKFVKSFEVHTEQGRLVEYTCSSERKTGDNIWYLYLCTVGKSPWFNNERYGDVLNPETVKKFLETAYEPYAEGVGEEFGKTIPAVFTDEPCFYRMENLKDGEKAEDIGFPYTEKMSEFYMENYHENLLEKIPEIVWEWEKEIISPVRYRYHKCLAELFTKGYAEQIGEWSRAHGLKFTGHLLGENSLDDMTRSTGEIIYPLSEFDLPGCDMLADRHEYVTAKQVQSAARQMGRKSMMCEIYGVTNWDFDFRGHRHMGDWLAALGVTARVPHLAWMTMEGEAKRDYPSPIDGHTTWYKKYHQMEDYYARLKTVLERGNPVVHIGVIHPAESYWIELGPDSTTAETRQRLEEEYNMLAEWLLFGQMDFDYLSEAMLADYGNVEKGKFQVKEMHYDTVIIPSLITIRQTTLNLLERFMLAGGNVIILGGKPSYVDGIFQNGKNNILRQASVVPFHKWTLYNAVEKKREISVFTENGRRAENLLYQMRQDGEERILFLAHGKKKTGLEYNLWSDAEEGELFNLRIKGCWKIQLIDCEKGEISALTSYTDKEETYFSVRLYEQDSLVLCLQPEKEVKVQAAEIFEDEEIVSETNWQGLVEYELSEENVLLLDQAEYSVDGKEWSGKEEILRIDEKIREELGYVQRSDGMPQPWTRTPMPEEHLVRLKFFILSEISVNKAVLVLENQDAEVEWNGKKVFCSGNEAYYVDRALKRIELNNINKGINILTVTFWYGQDTNMEWSYLLGDFGVFLQGDQAMIRERPKRLGLSDITVQGFPFYGGNVTYKLPVKGKTEILEMQFPEYNAVLLSGEIDGEQSQDFYKEPHKIRFKTVKEKEQEVHITVYGSRSNTFGQLHDCNPREEYYGPKTWRTKGKNWCYTYQIRPSGILVPPVIKWISKTAKKN